MTRKGGIHFLLLSISIFGLSLSITAFQEQFTVDDAPDELSFVHNESPGLKNCLACHTEDIEIDDGKCLSCHTEIAQRVSAERGYHQDKGEECAVCHSDHQGKDAKLIEFDTEDFDHEETGHSHQGAHKKITDCRACHRKEVSHPRTETQSYLLKDTRCPTCHQPPHPGNQDICLSCHNQKSWRVDIWNPEEFR